MMAVLRASAFRKKKRSTGIQDKERTHYVAIQI